MELLRGPGGSSIEMPPFAAAVSWNSRTCSGDSHLKPMVPPLAWVAASPLIGSLTQKLLPSYPRKPNLAFDLKTLIYGFRPNAQQLKKAA